MRLHSAAASLPAGPGGALGDVLASIGEALLGFTGGTLVIMGAAAAAFSLFTGLSWIRVAEKLRALIEWSYATVRDRIETRLVRGTGRIPALMRGGTVEVTKDVLRHQEPLRT